MNKVELIGRLTKNPELRYIQGSGTATCTVTIAIDRYNSKTKSKEADFIPVVIWNKQAENIATYMEKGCMIAVIGRIQTRSYEAKDGTKRYVTEVVADPYGGIEFLSKGKGQDINGTDNYGNMNQDLDGMTPVDDEEMPF